MGYFVYLNKCHPEVSFLHNVGQYRIRKEPEKSVYLSHKRHLTKFFESLIVKGLRFSFLDYWIFWRFSNPLVKGFVHRKKTSFCSPKIFQFARMRAYPHSTWVFSLFVLVVFTIFGTVYHLRKWASMSEVLEAHRPITRWFSSSLNVSSLTWDEKDFSASGHIGKIATFSELSANVTALPKCGWHTNHIFTKLTHAISHLFPTNNRYKGRLEWVILSKNTNLPPRRKIKASFSNAENSLKSNLTPTLESGINVVVQLFISGSKNH